MDISKENKENILVIDDQAYFLRDMTEQFEARGHTVFPALNIAQAEEILMKEDISIAVVDLDLDEHLQGFELIPALKKRGIFTAILTGYEDQNLVRKGYELGADHFIFKSGEFSVIFSVFDAKRNYSHLLNFRQLIKQQLPTNDLNLKNQFTQLEEEGLFTDIPILITGETGTGKSVLAEVIHKATNPKGRFISINCSQFTDTMIESELFGHKAGAFTGAKTDRRGLIAVADGGTLFLDEIGTMPLATQQKLLKAIDEKEFYPVGSDKKVKSSFRLISATCDPLKSYIDKGAFRKDFYYRIEGFEFHIPPLRERLDDIPLLLQHIQLQNSRAIAVTDKVLDELKTLPWDGNIRELRTFIERQLKAGKKSLTIRSRKPSRTFFRRKSEEDSSSFFLTDKQADYINTFGINQFIKETEFQYFLRLQKKFKPMRVRNIMGIGNSRYYRLRHRAESEGQIHD